MSEEIKASSGKGAGAGGNGDNSKLSLSLEELKALVSAAVASAVEQSSVASAKILADALLESRKPYLDPLQVQNEESMRQSMRDLHERITRDIKASQNNCPHFQGCNPLSEFQGQLSSIVQHRLDTGEVIGICTNCQRLFRRGDSDYIQQMQRKSGNRLSQAGQRMFLDPAAVQRAGQ